MKKFILFLLIAGIGASVYFSTVENSGVNEPESDSFSENYYDNSYTGGYYEDNSNNGYADYNNSQESSGIRDTAESNRDKFNSLMDGVKDGNSNTTTSGNTNNNTSVNQNTASSENKSGVTVVHIDKNKNNTNTSSASGSSTSAPGENKSGVTIVQIGDSKNNSSGTTNNNNTSTGNNTSSNVTVVKPSTNTSSGNTKTETEFDPEGPYSGHQSTANDFVKHEAQTNPNNVASSVSGSDPALRVANALVQAFKNEDKNAIYNLYHPATIRGDSDISGYSERFQYVEMISYVSYSASEIEKINKTYGIFHDDDKVSEAVRIVYNVTSDKHKQRYLQARVYKVNGKWYLDGYGIQESLGP